MKTYLLIALMYVLMCHLLYAYKTYALVKSALEGWRTNPELTDSEITLLENLGWEQRC